MKKIGCDTTKVKDGKEIIKPKVKYDSLKEAIMSCKGINAQGDSVQKLVPYKCRVCHKYHIGRNGMEITDKYRAKLNKDLDLEFPDRKANRAKKEIYRLSQIDKKELITEHHDKHSNMSDDRFPDAKFIVIGKVDLSTRK